MFMIDDNTARVIVAVCTFGTSLAQATVIVARSRYDRRNLGVGPRGPERSRPSPKAERLSGKRRPPGASGSKR